MAYQRVGPVDAVEQEYVRPNSVADNVAIVVNKAINQVGRLTPKNDPVAVVANAELASICSFQYSARAIPTDVGHARLPAHQLIRSREAVVNEYIRSG